MRRRRRRRRRRRGGISFAWKILFGVLLFVMIMTVGVTAFVLTKIRPGFDRGEIGLCLQEDGLRVFWPAFSEGSRCQLYRYDEEQGKYLFLGEYEENETFLDGVKEGDSLKLKFQTVRTIEDPFGKIHEVTGETKNVELKARIVESPVVNKTVYQATKKTIVEWKSVSGQEYEVYMQNPDGSWQLYTTTSEGWLELQFGENLSMPDRSEPLVIAVRTFCEQDDCVLYSRISEGAVIERRELMPEQVTLNWERLEECRYRLYWEESKGDLYELQQWTESTGSWLTLAVCAWNEPMEYETDRIVSNSEVKFRVITYDSKEEWESGKMAASPGEVSFRSEVSTMYCTIWPIIDLDLYEDSTSDKRISRVKAGKAFCVLNEKDGRFFVRDDAMYGYLDSRYCMINLPEYLGNLCEYEITNSYSSIFRVHEYDIPNLTDGVVKGYENVRLADESFLVPYLYPCAQKLKAAAESCREDGYVLKIYDAFRPNEATRYMYDTAFALLDYPLPEQTVTEENLSEAQVAAGADRSAEKGAGNGGAEDQNGDATDIYAGLLPEALALLRNMTAQEQAALGMTPETVELVSNLSPESLICLQNISYEMLTLLQNGGVSLPEEVMLEIQRISMEAQMLDSVNAAADVGDLTAVAGTADGLLQSNVRIDPAYLGVAIDAKGSGIRGMTAQDLVIWMSLAPDQLNAFKAYLQNTVQTYYKAMTDGRYRLGSFLAAVTSAHNRGIALDLTLESIDTKEALPMQSSMHDLSWHSALALNNGNADLLAQYMLAAGFKDLSSEWWHFQDDETREAIQLNSYLDKGVSVEGWKKDDNGWKYRLADGTYYKNTTAEIDGQSVVFDENGYCIG